VQQQEHATTQAPTQIRRWEPAEALAEEKEQKQEPPQPTVGHQPRNMPPQQELPAPPTAQQQQSYASTSSATKGTGEQYTFAPCVGCNAMRVCTRRMVQQVTTTTAFCCPSPRQSVSRGGRRSFGVYASAPLLPPSLFILSSTHRGPRAPVPRHRLLALLAAPHCLPCLKRGPQPATMALRLGGMQGVRMARMSDAAMIRGDDPREASCATRMAGTRHGSE